MFIEKIHMETQDEITGAKILSVKTKKPNILTPTRAAQNSWCTAFKKDKECSGKTLPNSWVELSNKIPNEEEMKNTIEKLGERADYLKSLNVPFRRKHIIEYFPTMGNEVKYGFDGKEKITTLINLGIFSKADVIGIPDFNENLSLFREKIQFSEKLILSHPEGENLDYIPYVRSDSRKFKDKLNIIMNEDINKIGIDYRGFSGVSQTNFNRLQNFKRDLDKDILVKVGHLPRKIYSTNASVPHLMYYFLADITADRVNNPPLYRYDQKKKKIPPRDIDTVEYFSSSDLGVLKEDALPPHFGTDCNCPYHAKERYNKENKFFINNGDEMGHRSKICEMFSSDLECQRSQIAIKQDNFLNYLRSKKCIKATLDLNNNSLDSFLH